MSDPLSAIKVNLVSSQEAIENVRNHKSVIVIPQNHNKSVIGESLYLNFMPQFRRTGAFFVLWRMVAFRDSALWRFLATRAMPCPHRNSLSVTKTNSEACLNPIENKCIYRKKFSVGLQTVTAPIDYTSKL